MTELIEVIVILTAIAMIALAIAVWFLCTSVMRIEGYMERMVLMAEMRQPPATGRQREKPPDNVHPQTYAAYEAPLVRKARLRMEAHLRRDANGA